MTKEEINQITITDLSFSLSLHAVPKTTTVHTSNKDAWIKQYEFAHP